MFEYEDAIIGDADEWNGDRSVVPEGKCYICYPDCTIVVTDDIEEAARLQREFRILNNRNPITGEEK